ncbi:MAG: dienelactone hydrolase family protein [Chloroflexi bacterium]|nr:dienelactone hydrolase family protein [Chloroflexota bacterium]
MILTSEIIHTDPNDPGPRAYLVRQAGDELRPGIVLIQEWWGIEPHVLDLAQRLASQGYAVMVPDLYHGQIATEPDDARKLVMMTMQNVERVIHEVTLALDHLRADPRVQPKKLALMGFCMGGTVTFKVACRYPHLAAVSPWYGGGIDPEKEPIDGINAPILAIYGEQDQGIPVSRVRALEHALHAAGKDATFHIYPNAGHAFLNDAHGSYHAESAADAWAKLLAFLKTCFH